MKFFFLFILFFNISTYAEIDEMCLIQTRVFMEQFEKKYIGIRDVVRSDFYAAKRIINGKATEIFDIDSQGKTAYDYIDQLCNYYEDRGYCTKIAWQLNPNYSSRINDFEAMKLIRLNAEKLGIRPAIYRVPSENEIKNAMSSESMMSLSKVRHVINHFIEIDDVESLEKVIDKVSKEELDKELSGFLNYAISFEKFPAVELFIRRSDKFSTGLIEIFNFKKLTQLFINNPERTRMIESTEVVHTPLMIAVFTMDSSLFKKLLKTETWVNDLSLEGKTVLDLLDFLVWNYPTSKTNQKSWKEMVEALEKRGAKRSRELPISVYEALQVAPKR